MTTTTLLNKNAVMLSLEAHTKAKQNFSKYANKEKAKQVYLNTLAVYAVEYYLQCRGYQTDAQKTSLQDKFKQILMNIADLNINNYGKVECLPILPNSQFMTIPEEVWSDRVAYIAVQLDQTLREATLLGFVDQVTTEQVPVSDLKDIDDIHEYINQFYLVTNEDSNITILSDWLKGVITQSWQKIEEILHPSQLQPAFVFKQKTSLKQNDNVQGLKLGQKITLDNPAVELILIITVTPDSINSDTINIMVEIYPNPEAIYLPSGLQMKLIVENQIIAHANPLEKSQSIYFQIDGKIGDCFNVEISLDELTIIKHFSV